LICKDKAPDSGLVSSYQKYFKKPMQKIVLISDTSSDNQKHRGIHAVP